MKRTKRKSEGKSKLPAISKVSRDLLTSLISASGDHAWEQDQGSPSAASNAEKVYKKARAKMVKHIADLERKAGVSAPKSKSDDSKTKPIWHLNINSTNLKKASFNFKKQRLLVEFHNGTRYIYDHVNLYEFLAFSEADSQGRWFSENIRDAKPCTKLD